MRRILIALTLSTLALPAWAADPQPEHKTRMTWQEHFAKANTSHDGHLTRDQADGGYASLAKHFDEIDTAHKGYITQQDIDAWHAARRASHKPARPPATGPNPAASMQPPTPAPIAKANMVMMTREQSGQ